MERTTASRTIARNPGLRPAAPRLAAASEPALPVLAASHPAAGPAQRPSLLDQAMVLVTDRVDRLIEPHERIKRHPAATLIPRPRPAQFRTLKASLREQGVLEPVVLSEGRLLDGHARLRACRALGIACPAIEIGPVEDPLGLVLARNVQRRHLRVGQLAMLAVRLCNRPRGGSPNAYAYAMDQGRAAELLGISRSAIGLASRIARSGRADLIQAVDAGTMPLRRAIAGLGGPASGTSARPAPLSSTATAVIPRPHTRHSDGPGQPAPGTPTARNFESERKGTLAHLGRILQLARRLGPDGETRDHHGFVVSSVGLPVSLLSAAHEVWECGVQEKFRSLRAVDPEMRELVGRSSALDRPDLERIEELAIYLERAVATTVAHECEYPMLPHLLWAPELQTLHRICSGILQVLDQYGHPDGPEQAGDLGPEQELEDQDENENESEDHDLAGDARATCP